MGQEIIRASARRIASTSAGRSSGIGDEAKIEGEEKPKERSRSLGIAWVGRERDCRDTKEVVTVGDEEAAARRAVLRRISLFPFGEPQEMPRICISSDC
jgi:hypothetical protein